MRKCSNIYIYIYIMLLLLALSGCAAAPEAGQAEITRIEPDGTALAYAEMLGGENIIAAEYSIPGTKSLTVEIQRHDGDGWSASARSVEFPNISDEGVLLLSFDSLAGGFGAAVLQPDGIEQVLQSAAEAEEAPPTEYYGIVFMPESEPLNGGEDTAAAMQYYVGPEGEILADIEDYARPESLGGYEAVYALVVRFE